MNGLPLLAFLATVVAIALVRWEAQPHRESHVAEPPLDLFAHPFAAEGHTMDRPDLQVMKLAGRRYVVEGVTPAGCLFVAEDGARVLDLDQEGWYFVRSRAEELGLTVHVVTPSWRSREVSR
jgi:hypothetical protein